MLARLVLALLFVAGCGSTFCSSCGGSPQHVGIRCTRPFDERSFRPICDYSEARYIGCYARRGTALRLWLELSR